MADKVQVNSAKIKINIGSNTWKESWGAVTTTCPCAGGCTSRCTGDCDTACSDGCMSACKGRCGGSCQLGCGSTCSACTNQCSGCSGFCSGCSNECEGCNGCSTQCYGTAEGFAFATCENCSHYCVTSCHGCTVACLGCTGCTGCNTTNQLVASYTSSQGTLYADVKGTTTETVTGEGPLTEYYISSTNKTRAKYIYYYNGGTWHPDPTQNK